MLSFERQGQARLGGVDGHVDHHPRSVDALDRCSRQDIGSGFGSTGLCEEPEKSQEIRRHIKHSALCPWYPWIKVRGNVPDS